MKAIIIGIILAAFAVFAVLPSPGLGWWRDVLFVVKGLVPIAAVFIGVIFVMVGAANLKDTIEAKKDAEEKAE